MILRQDAQKCLFGWAIAERVRCCGGLYLPPIGSPLFEKDDIRQPLMALKEPVLAGQPE
jgi:hypothetical protein